MYTIEDLVASAVAQKPGDFEEAFSSLMLEKISVAVEERKLYLAQTMFNPVEEDVEEVDEADIKGFSKNVMGGYSDATKNTSASGSGAGVQGSPGTQSGGGSIVKGRTGEADIYREGGKGSRKKK